MKRHRWANGARCRDCGLYREGAGAGPYGAMAYYWGHDVRRMDRVPPCAHPFDKVLLCRGCGTPRTYRYDATQVLFARGSDTELVEARQYTVLCDCQPHPDTVTLDPVPAPHRTEDDLLRILDRARPRVELRNGRLEEVPE